MRETFAIRVGYPVGQNEVPFGFGYPIGTLVLAQLAVFCVAKGIDLRFLLPRFAGLHFADFYRAWPAHCVSSAHVLIKT